MNRILYVLVGGGVAIAMISAFLSGRQTRPISEADVALAAAFITLLAGTACILTHTRWGRRLHWRSKRKLNEQDAEVRANARTKGDVRTPPLG